MNYVFKASFNQLLLKISSLKESFAYDFVDYVPCLYHNSRSLSETRGVVHKDKKRVIKELAMRLPGAFFTPTDKIPLSA